MTKFLSVVFWLPALLFGASAIPRDMTVEAGIEQELAAINPALVEPFRQARIALDKGDYAETARLLAPVYEKAPNFDATLRRYGSSLMHTGRATEGLALVEKAVAIRRSAANLASLATDLAFPPSGKPSRDDQERALSLLHECTRLRDGNDASILASLAQIALQLDHLTDARMAVETMTRSFPNLMPTHYFAAVVAAIDEHWIRAEDEIRMAQKLGLETAAVDRFLQSGVHSRATAWRIIRVTSWSVSLWALGLILLCGSGFALSTATLRQIARADGSIAITTGERRLRRIYRAVLNTAGFYYYISLPVVMVLVLSAAAAIIYGFLLIGRIPIQLTLALIVGAIVTVWSMGRSLFLRIETTDTGRVLSRADAEALWSLVEEVAAKLETRPIDEIRLTPGTELCVYERGTWREKMDNRAKRVLVLGAAVLNDFTLEDFRSVLAHEYGHFAHRDTAGGDVAFRVQNDMMKFYVAMLKAGQATWFNIAFHFLRLYHFIFRRISHGATRLQEVLADRVAAQAYGPRAFEGGLRHVIRSSLLFEAHANREITAALEARRPVHSLYDTPVAPTPDTDEAFAKAIDRPTTADDTHPAPQERFRLIAGIPEPDHPRAETGVWNLFGDRTSLLREMMETVEKNVAAHRT